jgi:hypothetical protein
MRYVDTPIRLAAGRTARELALIASGVGSIVSSQLHDDRTWNVFGYALVTLAFTTRFFAGRVMYLSMCFAALTLQLSSVMLGHVTLADRLPITLFILAHVVILLGGDLVVRFDDRGRGFGPFRNFWRDLPVSQRRNIALGAHAVAVLGAMMHHMAFNATSPGHTAPLWIQAGVFVASACGVLYLWGRAVAAPAALAFGVWTAAMLGPHVGGAWDALGGTGGLGSGLPWVHAMSPHYTVVAFAIGIATAAIALPWTIRWARLAVRSAP